MKRLPVLVATALTTALASATLVPGLASAAPVPPTQIAGDWISGELTDGLAVGSFGPDIGLSIDAGLALAAIGRGAAAQVVGDALGDELVTTAEFEYGYVRATEYDFDTHANLGIGYYANATAKAAAFTQRIGRDAATAYPSADLVDQLETLTSDTTGLIADVSSFGNYANTIGQAFAAEALTEAGSGEAGQATGALLRQQCPSGYFRFDLADTACAADTAGPAPDTTALAVLSLVQSGNTSPEVNAAITSATAWLESVQLADGSLEGDAAAPGSNANSTGLAAWALGLTGHAATAARAAAWTRSMQVADAGACVGSAPTGAIAYNPADLAAGRTSGLANATVRDKWRRASFQSMPGLQWAPEATAPLAIATPASAVEKTAVTATVRGLAAGEQGCVSLGSDARRVVGTGSDLSLSFTLPAGAGARTFAVTTLGASSTSTTTATAVPPAPTPTTTPAPAVPTVGELEASKVETVKGKSFKLEVACEGTLACTGKLKVRTAKKVGLPNGSRSRLLVAKSSYSVEPGETEKVKLTLTKPARALLGSKRLRVVASQTARNAEPASTKFWLAKD